jgi:hypothetical protein
VRIISILLVSVFHHILSWVLNVGHRLDSCERILLGSRSPSPLRVASSVLHYFMMPIKIVSNGDILNTISHKMKRDNNGTLLIVLTSTMTSQMKWVYLTMD